MTTIVSMFSGIGGLDIAATAVTGGRVVAHIENDPAASQVLATRFPGIPNLGDATRVDWTAHEPADVIVSGFSCQDISGAGQRAGITEESRSGITWGATIRAVRALRPRLVLLENVAAILTRGFDVVAADLATAGYDLRWTCLRASELGAPHRRDRWFAAAHPDGSAGTGQPHQGWRSSGRTAPRRDSEAAADAGRVGLQRRADDRALRGPQGPGAGEGLQRQRRGDPARDVRQAATDPDDTGPQGPQPTGRRHMPPGSGRPAAADPDGQARRRVEQGRGPSALPGTQVAERPPLEPRRRDSSSRPAGPVAWGEYEPAIRRWEHVTGIAAPAPTELSEGYVKMVRRRLERRDPRPVGRRGSLRPQHVLSPEFVEWMVGLPIGWTDVGISRSARLRCLGNVGMPAQAHHGWSRLTYREEAAA